MISLVDVTWKDINRLRKIRNQCRQYMTNNKDSINILQQFKWFLNLSDNIKPFIYYKDDIPIGYAIIKFDGNNCLLTGGLTDSYRGQGLGRQLFKLLIVYSLLYDRTPRLDVLKTNTRAFSLYKSLGFKIISEDDIKYTMEIRDE